MLLRLLSTFLRRGQRRWALAWLTGDPVGRCLQFFGLRLGTRPWWSRSRNLTRIGRGRCCSGLWIRAAGKKPGERADSAGPCWPDASPSASLIRFRRRPRLLLATRAILWPRGSDRGLAVLAVAAAPGWGERRSAWRHVVTRLGLSGPSPFA